MELLTAAAILIIGLVVGFLGGMFGIGGAVVAIPLMRILLGFSGAEAIATALPITIPTALSGSVHYAKHKLIKYKTVAVGGLVGIVFSVAGALLTQYFSGEILMLLVGGFLLVMAVVISQEKGDEEPVDIASTEKKLALTGAVGGVAGFISGFLGIGGGALLVPLLMKVRRIPLKKAVPTSLAMIAIYAIPGALTHYFMGNIDLAVVAVLVVGCIIGANVGARMATKIDEKKHRQLLATLLVLLGLILIFNELVRQK
ncbi:MAG: sulfite exporter TauE/SafE family protein [Candidatus Micrarchaeota archaeon]